MIQSCNGSNKKSQFIENENFTKSSYSMMMEEFEYRSLLKQLKKKNLIFDDVMHKEKCTLIH